MNENKLTISLKQSPIVKKGTYHYVVHPITDGIPEITPDLLREVSESMLQKIESYVPLDRIVTMEAMGIPLASILSLEMNIPFTIIRKRSYGLPDEQSVKQQTGYSKANMFINGLKKNDKIVIVDDVISTGGTLKAVLQTLKQMRVIVKAVVVAVDKGNVSEQLAKETGVPIQSLVHISVSENKVKINQRF